MPFACPHTNVSSATSHVPQISTTRQNQHPSKCWPCDKHFQTTAAARDKSGYTPLHILLLAPTLNAHSLNIVKLILEKLEGCAQILDHEGMLPLHHVCRASPPNDVCVSILKVLLEAYEKSALIPDKQGHLALHLVCQTKDLSTSSSELVRRLLLAFKMGHSAQDKEGRLPLHCLLESMEEKETRAGVEQDMEVEQIAADVFEHLLMTDKSGVMIQDKSLRLPIHSLCHAGLDSPQTFDMFDQLLTQYEESAQVRKPACVCVCVCVIPRFCGWCYVRYLYCPCKWVRHSNARGSY
jgi:hypothetical protein